MIELAPIVPFEPVLTERVPKGDKWVGQVKFDGVRMLTYFDGSHVRLFNRKLHERTSHYPELLGVASYCHADSVILDGEIIAFTEGKPSFYQVMRRDGVRRVEQLRRVQSQIPIAYMVFDLIYLNGESTTLLPLSHRQSLLSDILKPHETVHVVDNFMDVRGLIDAVRLQGLEGVVIKDLTSQYLIRGKDARWQKRKFLKDLVAVVGGVTYREGIVNALLLGLYDEEDHLRYIGKAGGGHLSQADWRQVTQVVPALTQHGSPFSPPPKVAGATWISPHLTVKIEFLEWNETATLRHPVIQSFVETSPHSCRFDTNC